MQALCKLVEISVLGFINIRTDFILFTSGLHQAILGQAAASSSTLLPKTSLVLKLRAKKSD